MKRPLDIPPGLVYLRARLLPPVTTNRHLGVSTQPNEVRRRIAGHGSLETDKAGTPRGSRLVQSTTPCISLMDSNSR